MMCNVVIQPGRVTSICVGDNVHAGWRYTIMLNGLEYTAMGEVYDSAAKAKQAMRERIVELCVT